MMNLKDIRDIVMETLGDVDCPHSKDHCYRVATRVMERQREDDANLAEAISHEAAEAIRGS